MTDTHATRREAAGILGVSLSTIDRMLKAGTLPYAKLPSGQGQPKTVRIPRAALALMLKETRP